MECWLQAKTTGHLIRKPSSGEAKSPDRFSSCLYSELIMETVLFSMKNEPGGQRRRGHRRSQHSTENC